MRLLCLFLVSLFAASSLAITPAVYEERSSFDEALPGLHIERFDEEFVSDSSASFAGFAVSEQSSAARISWRTDSFLDPAPSLGFTWNGGDQLTFDFDPPVTAFAVDVLDFGTCCGATRLVVADDTDSWQVDAITLSTDEARPERGTEHFFGIVAEQPFSSLVFTSDQNSTNDLIVFDNVSFLAVPEPKSIYFAATCLIAFLTVHRRRMFTRTTVSLTQNDPTG